MDDKQQPEYGTVNQEILNEDGTVINIETGFFNNIINKRKVSIRKDIMTTEANWLKDLLANLSPMKGDSPSVTIVIKKDKYNKPYLLQITWISENYHKRITKDMV